MSDKETIIRTLERIERRIRANRLFNELALGATFFLAFPVAWKIWDLFDPFRASTIAVVAGTWILLFAGYVVWCGLQRTPRNRAAASVDKAADLKDEIKTAVWFIHNPRPSEWVEAQIHRAAQTARTADLNRFFPRRTPNTIYIAATLLVCFIGLNFAPLPWNHNWLALQAAPAFNLTAQEAEILRQTEALLRKADELKKSDVAQQLEEIVQQLQEGKLDAAKVLEKLGALKTQLDEGNLDTASMREGLEQMAEALSQSDKLEQTADAIKNRELNKAAEELRKAAEKLGLNTSESSKQMQKSLEKASENPRVGLEELAKHLNEAAEELKKQNQEGAQEALAQAGQDLDTIEQKIHNQELKNQAAQQLQNLQQSLQQRQQVPPSEAKNAQDQKGQRGQQPGNKAGGQEAGFGKDGEPTDEMAEKGGEAAAAGEGNGLMPSGKGGGDAKREGPPTTLDVQLKREEIEGIQDQEQGIKEDIDEVSKQERSKLDYRNVKSDLSPAQKDLLNQDHIPWEYRSLIKNYFEAIRPPSKK